MVVLILANTADPDEMQHIAAFHLGLHCLPQNPFRVSSISSIKQKSGTSVSCGHTYLLTLLPNPCVIET